MLTPNRIPRHKRGRSPIIGLAGYGRSGKDTVAAYLVENQGWTRFAFADAVRRILLATDPIVRDVLPGKAGRLSTLVAEVGWDEAKAVPEVRRLLQAQGMSAREVLGEDVWVSAVLDQFYARERGIVIADVRFPNEVEGIRRKGGIIVRVTRPGVGPVNGHASETAIDHIRPDWTIDNSGSMGHLHQQIDHLLATEINP